MAADGDATVRAHSRFVTARDGARLHVQTYGPARSSFPTLVLLDGLGCDGYVWKYVIDWFQPNHRIVHWQYRGHGQSDPLRTFADVEIAQTIGDLESVLDATDVENAVVIGHSMGVQVALETFRQLRARVVGLGLLFGSYEYPIESWHGAPARRDPPTPSNVGMRLLFDRLTRHIVKYGFLAQPLWRRVVKTHFAYEIATRTEVDGERLSHEDFKPYLDHLAEMDCRAFFAFARGLARHSAKDVLSSVDVPTLVMGGGRDTFTPLWRSLEMGHRVRDVDLFIVDEGTHSAPLEQPARINQRIARFLRMRFPAG